MANSSRFTIVNENAGNILMSKTLRDQIKSKEQQLLQRQQSQKDVPSSTIESKSKQDLTSSIQKNDSITNENYPSIYPELPSLPATPQPPSNQNRFDFTNQNQFTRQQNETFQQQIPVTPNVPSNFGAAFDPNYLLLELRGEYESKLQQYQNMWRQNLEKMDRLNKDLLKKNNEMFSNEVKRIDASLLQKHFDLPGQKDGIREQPCKETEDKLLRCYQVNGKKTLHCSKLVQDFVTCIDQTRMDMLKQK